MLRFNIFVPECTVPFVRHVHGVAGWNHLDFDSLVCMCDAVRGQIAPAAALLGKPEFQRYMTLQLSLDEAVRVARGKIAQAQARTSIKSVMDRERIITVLEEASLRVRPPGTQSRIRKLLEEMRDHAAA